MGVKKVQPAATFGHPYGMNSTSPEQFLKSHAQEPLMPERKLHVPTLHDVSSSSLMASNYALL